MINDKNKIAELGIINVSIDTSIFEKNNLNFKSGTLFALQGLSSIGVTILVTEMVYYELLKHTETTIHDNFQSFKQSSKKLIHYDFFDSHFQPIFESYLQANEKDISVNYLNNAMALLNVNIVKFNKITDSSELFMMYVNKRPPFEAKKKNEFPDAISLLLLDNYAKERNEKIAVVSSDQDWLNYCKESQWLFPFDDLSIVLETFHKNHSAVIEGICLILSTAYNVNQLNFKDKLNSEIIYVIENSFFFAEGNSGYRFESEINEVNVTLLKVFDDSFSIINNTPDELTIQILLVASVEVDAHFSFSIYDEGDITIGSSFEQKEFEIEITGTFKIGFPHKLIADSINLDFYDLDCVFSYELDFGEIHPNWNDDDNDEYVW